MNSKKKYIDRYIVCASSENFVYIYIYSGYLYSHPQTDLFRSIRTHQCSWTY